MAMEGQITIQAPATPAEAPATTPASAAAPAAAPSPAAPPAAEVRAEARPDWLPSKFKDAKQMAEAYSELEKKLGGGSEATTPEAPAAPATEAAPAVQAPTNEVSDALKAAGIDYNALSLEYANNEGKLGDDSYAKLAKAGYPKTLVDGYLSGQKALADNYAATVHSFVGGQEAHDSIMAWAKTALTPAEKAAYNATVNSGNQEAVKLALQGLQARAANEGGTDPQLLNGRSAVGGSDVFESSAQVTEAMRDPRYAKDPAYRQKVADKVMRSQALPTPKMHQS